MPKYAQISIDSHKKVSLKREKEKKESKLYESVDTERTVVILFKKIKEYVKNG